MTIQCLASVYNFNGQSRQQPPPPQVAQEVAAQPPQPEPAEPEVVEPSAPLEKKLEADISFSQFSRPQSGQTIFSGRPRTSSSKSRPQSRQ
jgi:hypothetical protein